MKELVLDLIQSYENSILSVAELIADNCESSLAPGEGLSALEQERGTLTASLREVFARSCSLRKKDFNRLIAGVLSESEQKRQEIEAAQQAVLVRLKGYLAEQRAAADSLKGQITGLEEGEPPGELTKTVSGIKGAYRDTGAELFALMRSFQSRLAAFQKEQWEINQKLADLAHRGEGLTVDDLRQLEAGSPARIRRDRPEAARQLARLQRNTEKSIAIT